MILTLRKLRPLENKLMSKWLSFGLNIYTFKMFALVCRKCLLFSTLMRL